MVRKSVGDILLEKRFITADQLDQAREVQKSAPGDIGKIIVDLGFAAERDVVESKAQAEGLPFIDLTKHKPEPSAVNVVPAHVARRHNALPVKKDGTKLWVAMMDPRNVVALDEIRMVSRCQVAPLAAVPSDLEDALASAYGNGDSNAVTTAPSQALTPSAATGGQSLASIMNELGPGSRGGGGDDDDAKSDEDASNQAPIIRMANAVLVQAIDSGASDIHIEPDSRNVRIRCRIDGVLHEIMKVPNHIKGPLISRYKIMSDMNIAERRVPQDGRIPLKHSGKDYDMRVSCLPSMFGEKIVMRILDKAPFFWV
jgi:type IV pilus assembly protein PilB